MSRLICRNQKLPVSLIDKIMHSLPDLQYKFHQQLKDYLSNAIIRTMLIRQNIIEEGSNFKKGILVIQGTILIHKKIENSKIVFAQLSSLQIANIQIFLYERAYYTLTVHSSQLKYVQIPQHLLKALFNSLKNITIEKQNKRNAQIDNKIKEIALKQKISQKQKMIDKLSLPTIRYFSRELKKSNSQTLTRRKQDLSPNAQVQSVYDIKNPLKILSKEALRNNLQLKPVQSYRNIIKNQVSYNNDANRNQKLFKEHLKTIIKRKIVYERKQLGAIRQYRNNKPENIVQRQNANYLPAHVSQIDQYFRI